MERLTKLMNDLFDVLNGRHPNVAITVQNCSDGTFNLTYNVKHALTDPKNGPLT